MHSKSMTAAVLGGAMFLSSFAMGQEPSTDPKDLAKEIAKLKKKVEEHSGTIILLETRIELLENELKELNKKKSTGKVESLKPETSGTRTEDNKSESFKGMGRLRLVNEFTEEMSVLVNGKPYRILPGGEKLLPITPGTYTYQVLQLQRTPQERTIAVDETKTVRIYPIN